MKLKIVPQFSLPFLLLAACPAPGGSNAELPRAAPAETRPDSRTPLDLELLSGILEVKGAESNGQYKVSVPQDELDVKVDGFRISPPMGLTSWAAFAPAPAGAVVMGDLVVLEDEIGPVERTLIDSGLTVTALHNHFVRDEPKVMFMHIHSVGSQENLARGVRATIAKIHALREAKGLDGQAVPVDSTFDPATIDSIIGQSGTMTSNVYKLTIGRPDVRLVDHGSEVTAFTGFNTWMAFQGTPDRAAVSGDFAMLESEVAGVIKALVDNNIEVVAVHNHMVTEAPRIFFLHFWGVGSTEALARGLRAALDQVGG